MREVLVPPGAALLAMREASLQPLAKATRPMNKSDWIEWEIKQARHELARANDSFECHRYFKRELSSALNHAVWAWTRAHSTQNISHNQSNHETFSDEAPVELVQLHKEAVSALSRLEYGFVSAGSVIETVTIAI